MTSPPPSSPPPRDRDEQTVTSSSSIDWRTATFEIVGHWDSELSPPGPVRITTHCLTTLTPHPWLAPTTHATVLAHLASPHQQPFLRIATATLVPILQDPSGNYYSSLLRYYSVFFCSRSAVFQTGPNQMVFYGREDGCPPPFYALMEELLLFHVHVLEPYYYRWAMENSRRVDSKGEGWELAYWRKLWSLSYLLLRLSYLFCHRKCNQDGKLTIQYIPARYLSGLMRDRQIRLLRMVVGKMMEQMRELLKLQEDEEEFNEGVEISRIVEASNVIIEADKFVRFLGGRRFRSEKLEILICRYLDEEVVNWEFVRARNKVQRESDRTKLERARDAGREAALSIINTYSRPPPNPWLSP